MQSTAMMFVGNMISKTSLLKSYRSSLFGQSRYSDYQSPSVGDADAHNHLTRSLLDYTQQHCLTRPMPSSAVQQDYDDYAASPSTFPDVDDLSGIDLDTHLDSLHGYAPVPLDPPLGSGFLNAFHGSSPYDEYAQGNHVPLPSCASSTLQTGLYTQLYAQVPLISPPLSISPPSQMGLYAQGNRTISPPLSDPSSSQSDLTGDALTIPARTPYPEQDPFSIDATGGLHYLQSLLDSIPASNLNPESTFEDLDVSVALDSFGEPNSQLLKGESGAKPHNPNPIHLHQELATQDTYFPPLDTLFNPTPASNLDYTLGASDAYSLPLGTSENPASSLTRGRLPRTRGDIPQRSKKPAPRPSTRPSPVYLKESCPIASTSTRTKPKENVEAEDKAGNTSKQDPTFRKFVRGFVYVTPELTGRGKRRRASDEGSEGGHEAKRPRRGCTGKDGSNADNRTHTAVQLPHAVASGDGVATSQQQQVVRVSTDPHVPKPTHEISGASDQAGASTQTENTHGTQARERGGSRRRP